jgi:acetate kinase
MAMAIVDATPQPQVLLVVNCGSSSLKASCFQVGQQRLNFHYRIEQQPTISQGFEKAFSQLFADLGDLKPNSIVHRFVFGGDIVQTSPRLIDQTELARLMELVPFAPLHLPLSLLGVRLCAAHFHDKGVSQWACFDNAFHSTLPALAYRFAIPEQYQLRRFGFHGLNYAHVAKQLPKILGNRMASGRIVIAHLGSGCSLCMLDNLQSVETSMGYSTAGGIPMATRSGDLDPGLVLALSQQLDPAQLEDLIFHQSGLLSLSNGESSDMQTLLASDSPAAKFAVDYFARSVRAVIGSYAAKVGGIDALVFTGGIGEHAPQIRTLICEPLSFLGFQLSGRTDQSWLSDASSKPILVIPADEEAEMASQLMLEA